MATRNNAASRIANLLERVQGSGTQGTSMQGWGRVFSIEQPESASAEREVAQLLSLAQREIDGVRHILEAENKDPRSYEAILNRAGKLFSVQQLGAGWSSVVPQLGADLVAGFLLLAEFLPDEEPMLEAEALNEIIRAAETWERSVRESSLPNRAKRFLIDQVDFVRRAIRQYPIRGSSAFATSILDASVEWNRRSSDIEGYEDTKEARGVRELWPDIEKICKRTILIGGAVAAIVTPIAQILGLSREQRLLPPTFQLEISPPLSPPVPGDSPKDHDSRGSTSRTL